MNIRYYLIIAIFCVGMILLSGCQPLNKLTTSYDINKRLNKTPIFSDQHSGLALYDPAIEKILISHSGQKQFTPASNIKILTALAILQTLGDSIPSFMTLKEEDTLWVVPFGDPTFLHPDFLSQGVVSQLQKSFVNISIPANRLTPYGPGWAWDDYDLNFQTERSELPIYGNMLTVDYLDSAKVTPRFFDDYTDRYASEKPLEMKSRSPDYNIFNTWTPKDTSRYTHRIPIKWNDELLVKLLEDTLKANVSVHDDIKLGTYSVLYNTPTLSALSLMMFRSDNFLAEQLLLVSSKVNKYSTPDILRARLIKDWELDANTQWVDGSGLSRYNLISPQSLINVLSIIYKNYDWKTITQIFPAGGVSGTIKDWYGGSPAYLFAKTGSMSNVHCISGFIKTDSGKTLIFSFMNNNFTVAQSDLKKEMQVIFEAIRDAY
ncbi:MAG: D-alanyl-D-alanine carboxypeptidase/D-alanyl-D-alanine-endopeptidase (penicillin-binding protein 4) [Marinoscillum sp.]|jgi:D-alanyl-D-alanine carboxypeptidase/D-alanyl-D-alanine-endopeptidase (penicillin-binding protein 4)